MTSAAQVQPAMPAKRILVVEDELMIRMLLEDMLGELGYTVTAEAGRLDEALQAAKTSASRVMNGSSVISSRSGVTAMRLSASAEMSLPSAGGCARMRT